MLPYKNPDLSPRERAKDLLGRMTLEEKIAQMRLSPKVEVAFDPDKFDREYPNGLGATYNTVDIDTESVDRMQAHMLTGTRLGIPIFMMSESLHGFMNQGATVFPQAIGLGATFNTDLMAEIADVIGREARAAGVTETYAPNLDLSRDPRWGRVEENYGEDPYLTSKLGVEYVKGLQKNGVASSPKHYVAHGSPEGGVNLGPVHAGERELRELYLPPFAAAVREGGALSMMPAYSELDGVPLHASKFLLTDILRGELGFEGFTVSDFGAIEMLYSFQRVAEDGQQAGIQTLTAGMDMEAPNMFGFGEALNRAVNEGKVDVALIDQAVERILYVKFLLGLFENPYRTPDADKVTHTPASVELSRRAARESIVLLKNENNLLPLSESIDIALIGPSAKAGQVGDYSAREAAGSAVSVYEGLISRIGAARVHYAAGASIASATDESISEAARAAKNSDVAILVLGDNSNFYGGVGWGDANGAEGAPAVTCGEGFDLSDLTLPGRQQELLEAVCATGTPTVLLLMTGRPYAISWAKDNVAAILEVWYPGEQGGHAICDLLFGDYNPSGKLPISFPRSAGHIPCFYNHKVSARGFYKSPGTPLAPGRDYVFSSPDSLYPFGYGLSYTRFEYSGLSISPLRATPDEPITVRIKVKNAGDRAGEEVVQLYLADLVCRITPFVRRLRGFKKIRLEPGEERAVEFTLGREDLSFINEDMLPEVEPGAFRVEVGGLSAEFTVE